jgi:hypothetical protein
MARFDGHTPSEEDGIPESVADFLRRIYPQVTVHRSDRLAEFTPSQRTLYIYRDGSPLAK